MNLLIVRMWGKGQDILSRLLHRDDYILYGGELFLDNDLPRMFFRTEDANKYVVKWNRSKYYNAVDSFVSIPGK